MKKDNTILLTVIAIATLIVATIGASFAYFSTVDTSTSTTDINVKMPHVGVVSVDSTHGALYLNATSEQMDEGLEADTKYYAIYSEDPNASASPDKTIQNFAVFTSSLGGAEIKYSCDANLTISISEGMAALLQDGDAYIGLEANGSIKGYDSGEISLNTLYNNNLTKKIHVDLTGNTNTALTGYVYINNLAKKDQKYIADKTLKINVSVSGLVCTAS